MIRYKFTPNITITDNPSTMERTTISASHLSEDGDGEWVRWSDVEALREFLELQIPEHRIRKLEIALGLVNEGRCPECGQKTRDFKPIFGSCAPEAWETMRENGIDPADGHKVGCSLK